MSDEETNANPKLGPGLEETPQPRSVAAKFAVAVFLCALVLGSYYSRPNYILVPKEKISDWTIVDCVAIRSTYDGLGCINAERQVVTCVSDLAEIRMPSKPSKLAGQRVDPSTGRLLPR
jgi:hypothetical protein